MTDLRKEFTDYLARESEYLGRYRGKYIALKDGVVLGVYDDRLDAIRETAKVVTLGTFIVQHVIEDAAHARFHSRVAG